MDPSILVSSGPAAERAAGLAFFVPLIGSWSVDITDYKPDGARRARGEWHFFWALDGLAVADVWIVPSREERARGAPAREWGLTVRLFDPAIGTIRSTWHGPRHGVVMPFIARSIGSELVLEGSFEEGDTTRWIFSEVTEASFHWRAVRSSDGGASWTLEQEMNGIRLDGGVESRGA